VSKKDVAQHNEESLLEQAFRIETLYKKHKIKLWITVALIVLLVIGKLIWNAIEEHRLQKANSAYLTLMEEKNNTEALQTLEANNPKLYELYRYSTAIKSEDKQVLQKLTHSSNEIVADLSRYALSVLEEKPANSTLFGDFSKLQRGYLHIQNQEFERAREVLELVPEESNLYEYASRLKHLTIKGE
jgi:hypothetical protein